MKGRREEGMDQGNQVLAELSEVTISRPRTDVI